MKLYTTRISCEVAGTWREATVPFPLSDEQAKYLAPPFGSVVSEHVDEPASEEDAAIDTETEVTPRGRRNRG